MVVVHVRTEGTTPVEEFIFEATCATTFRAVRSVALDLVRLRRLLRSAARRAGQQHEPELLAADAVRRKTLVSTASLGDEIRRLAGAPAPEEPPFAPPATDGDLGPQLLFAGRTLPPDDSALRELVGTNEKSKVLVRLKLGSEGAAPCDEMLQAGASAPATAPAAEPAAPAEEVSLLAFVKRRRLCAAAEGAPASTGDQEEGGEEEDDEGDMPKLKPEHMQRLDASSAVRRAMADGELRRTLQEIDAAPRPERALARALEDDRFRDFVHTMLVAAGLREEDDAGMT